MGPFNRNIITGTDVKNLLDPGKGTPRTLDAAPPAGDIPATPQPVQPAAPPAADGTHAAADTPTAAPGGVKVPVADDYLTKLLKFVPLEVLGAYLFIEGLVTTNVDDADELQNWLFWILAAAVVLSAVYARVTLNVVRISQIAMSALGLAVYVFATGGWFATTEWYEDWFSGLSLAVFAIVVAIVKLPGLPTEDN